MKILRSLLFGALLAVAGALFHSAYRPFGLAITLFALFYGAQINNKSSETSLGNLAFLTGWIVLVSQASIVGNGGEILIQGNSYGYLYIILGIIIMFIQIIRFRRSR
jgi:hypothetical protein